MQHFAPLFNEEMLSGPNKSAVMIMEPLYMVTQESSMGNTSERDAKGKDGRARRRRELILLRRLKIKCTPPSVLVVKEALVAHGA